ncbi:Cuticle protein 8 [Orchesella cincta]|uniref:Cuticle protein 8 n=1 Tax=Orchesella cincta TaxID=48709 RepID=A0A1D2NGW0_ORCCI|nr:Cuticle protein 8 [Orchesella cincta]
MKVAVFFVVCLLHLNEGVLGANPNYSYHVKIDDPTHVNFQEKAETRKGEDAQGFYSVLEPNGALRTVSYTADERGFNPVVSYSYGHAQSSVAVTSAIGAAAFVNKQPGVYAPAYVADNRVQIVDKSNIYAAPPPALNLQAFSLPGPSSPVVVPAPLRQVAPVRLASAAIATNYAPAYVPPPRAYLPPPQPQVLTVQQPQVVTQVVQQQPQVIVQQQPQVYVQQQPQVIVQQQQPQVVTQYVQQPQVLAVTKVRPAKFLTVPAPAVKVVKSTPAVAIVKDSYAEPPRDTFRDPNAQSYPESVKVVQPVAEYGPPSYVPPPPITEAPLKVQVVQQQPQPVKVIQPVQQPVYQQIAVQAPPPPAIAVQKVAVQAAPVLGLYAGAIGYHTHTNNPDSYLHSYGTQGFQVTSSRKFNKAILNVPQVQRQVYQAAPPQVYGPPPQQIRVVQPAPVYGPPPQQQIRVVQPAPGASTPQVRVVQPAPVYGPPPVKVVQQQLSNNRLPLLNLSVYKQSHLQHHSWLLHKHNSHHWKEAKPPHFCLLL